MTAPQRLYLVEDETFDDLADATEAARDYGLPREIEEWSMRSVADSVPTTTHLIDHIVDIVEDDTEMFPVGELASAIISAAPALEAALGAVRAALGDRATVDRLLALHTVHPDGTVTTDVVR